MRRGPGSGGGWGGVGWGGGIQASARVLNFKKAFTLAKC